MARVLVVEPDRQIREFVDGILTDFGHQVHSCDNACEARRLLQHTRIDVIVADPSPDGRIGPIAALAQSLPVLTLSGSCHRTALQRRECPVRLHDKPFRLAALRDLAAAVAARKPVYVLAA